MLSAGPVQVEALHAALAALGGGSGSSAGGGAVGSGAGASESADAGAPRGAGGGPRYDSDTAALPSAPDVNDELVELIDRQPDEVASILRGWLADRRA